MASPLGHKLSEEIDFLQSGHFWPRAIQGSQVDLTPLLQKLLVRIWTGSENLSKVLSMHKRYSDV
jgi:hypothetical protein